MHCQAIVFGDHPERLMDSLIQTSGQMPADVSVPLEVTDSSGRSGWHTVNDGHRQFSAQSAYGYGNWVHCAWPTSFLREQLGPCAILNDAAINQRGVEHFNVQQRGGRWCAQVPRFFDTIGDHWSLQTHPDRYALVTTSGRICSYTTVGELDLAATLVKAGPCLIVGPDGPVFYDEGFGPGKEDFADRRMKAAAPLMDLPPDTLVSLVDWHG